MTETREKEGDGVTGQSEEKGVWCQNMKFKALVLIQSRMDGIRVDACMHAYLCVCVCAVEIWQPQN